MNSWVKKQLQIVILKLTSSTACVERFHTKQKLKPKVSLTPKKYSNQMQEKNIYETMGAANAAVTIK